MQTGSDEFRISHMPDVILSYHMQRIFTPWCQNSYHKVPVPLLNYVILPRAQTTTLQGQINSGLTRPHVVLPQFFLGYECS